MRLLAALLQIWNIIVGAMDLIGDTGSGNTIYTVIQLLEQFIQVPADQQIVEHRVQPGITVQQIRSKSWN